MAEKLEQREKKVTSKFLGASIAPRKVVDIANQLRGMNAIEAVRFLTFNPKKASDIIINIVKSGIANGTNTFGLNADDMYIEDIKIGGGPTRKSGRIAGKSVYKPIKKRTTNILVILGTKQGEKNESKS